MLIATILNNLQETSWADQGVVLEDVFSAMVSLWCVQLFTFPLLAVCVRTPLPEGVEPQPLHGPAVCHPLWSSAFRLFLQLTAGGPPHGTTKFLSSTGVRENCKTTQFFFSRTLILRWVKSVYSAADHLDWQRAWRRPARRWTRETRPTSFITMRTFNVTSPHNNTGTNSSNLQMYFHCDLQKNPKTRSYISV